MSARARWIVIAGLAVAAAGCAAILGIDDGTPRDGDASGDAALSDVADTGALPDAPADAGDGSVAMCDVDAAFSVPTAFATLDSTASDAHLRLAPNELSGYFQTQRDGGLGNYDVYTATRTSIGDTWTAVGPVTPVNSSAAEVDPSVSGDLLTLYLSRSSQLMRATRASASAAFGAPALVPVINSAASDFGPYVIADNSALYFSSTRNSDAGVAELFVTQPLADGGFTAPANVNGAALKTGDNRFAAVTDDQLVLYFGSNRTGGQGNYDIWVATRASTSVAFGTPRVVAEVSSASDETPDWVSSDRCRLYFSSNRGASYDLYVASKLP
ncbi:MAG TPA: hypothetical protein VH054_04205 [Polyangiaceae bacterium]|jgi:hypothetical protein|nr:hypothetical protein [Polyangiaceae bacterium]